MEETIKNRMINIKDSLCSAGKGNINFPDFYINISGDFIWIYGKLSFKGLNFCVSDDSIELIVDINRKDFKMNKVSKGINYLLTLIENNLPDIITKLGNKSMNKKIKYKNQPKVKLTKEMVENADSGIIKKGHCFIRHPWFNQAKSVKEGGNLEKDGKSVEVKYVIFRGEVADWCIYHSLDANFTRSKNLQSPEHLKRDFEEVMKYGGKLHNKQVIKSIVDCTDEVYDLYRH